MIKALFDWEEITQAQSEVDHFMKHGAKTLTGRDINLAGTQVNSIHRLQKSRWVDGILNSQSMKDFVTPFLNDEPEPRKSELFAKPAHAGLPAPPHQDNYLFCVEGGNALTIWVALDRSTSANGALYYYEGSHLVGLVPHEKSFAPGTSQQVAKSVDLARFRKVVPELEPGDALVHHSEIIHGSEPNKSNTPRRGWTLQYKGRSSTYDNDRLAQYEKDLAEQLASRGSSASGV